MSFFGLFGKKKATPDPIAWAEVTGKIAGLLWHFMQTDPKVLMSPFARVVLRDDWNVGIANDHCDPKKILGDGAICFVFLQEDQAALEAWIKGLRKTTIPVFQQAATEEYAKKLVSVLIANVDLVD